MFLFEIIWIFYSDYYYNMYLLFEDNTKNAFKIQKAYNSNYKM